ncbi:MAG: hypothetical protein M1820_009229 [Bogoriella megaspora]|nr:MAG: hypothetical protein M1820_009229 [Bogoriella megaspora]
MSGLPLVASSEAFCTTQMIGEVKDEFIGNQPDTTNVERPLVYLDPGYVLTVGRYEATALLREILLNQYGPEPLKNGDITALRGKIALFRRKIEERIRRLLLISESQHRIDCATPPSPSDVPQPDTSAFRRWAEESLHLMIEKAYCLLYQPLTQDRTLWAAMRQEALPHFQEFLGIFVRMCDNQYRPFHWLYPGAYQPLQSSAALLIDLLKYPITEESWKSRAVLESVFALLGSQDRIAASFETLSPTQRSPSVGARHAWARLEKVRRKAWTKLGLDSTVQWDRRAGPTHSSPSLKNNTSRSPVVENPAQMIPSWVFEDVGIETEMTTMGDAQDAIFQNLDSGLCNAPNPPISDPYQFPGSACSTDATMTSADYITSINSTLAYEHDANFANFVDSTRSVDVSLIDDIANQAFDHFLVPELGQEIDWNLEQEE